MRAWQNQNGSFLVNPLSKASMKKILAAVLMALTFSTHAQTEVAGVKFDETLDLRGNKVLLNGAGVRYKAVFKVYAAGLYLGKKAGTSAEAFAAPGAKRVSVTMLRDIDSNELSRLFSRGVEDNLPKADFGKVIPSLIRMSQVFTDLKTLKTGDNFTIDWIPGTGMVMSVKGKPQGEPFTEPAFFNAMLNIWLGASPADWKLKDAMLGIKS
jgi:Chalcone isomerase-like